MSTTEPTKQYEGRGVNTYAQELLKQLGQRDDTITTLRAERDALARERDRLRGVLEQVSRLDYLREHNALAKNVRAALKGEMSENP